MDAQSNAGEPAPEPRPPRWSPIFRIAFRFCFVYFALFGLTTQIFGELFPIPNIEIPDPATLWPLRPVVFWTAAHVFGVRRTLVDSGSGSGDKTFDWVLTFCLLVFAAFATAVWSVLDRKRENYTALNKWFRLFLRFALASELLVYGLSKVIPLQMPFPYLTRLLEPYGNFSPMAALWYSIGASPAYETFTGSVEVLAGLLLFVPRTATLGALVSLAAMTQVFVLNMTYDVPVKLFSFHLILISLLVLAPESSRLARFFFTNRPVGPSTQPELFGTRRANRIALSAQIGFGVLLIASNLYSAGIAWHKYGGGRPRSPLYGIWTVDALSVDGKIEPSYLSGADRFRRVIFDFPGSMVFERMNGSLASYGVTIDMKSGTLVLTKRGDKAWKAAFKFQRAAQTQLTLDGLMDGHGIHMQLDLVDLTKFPLAGRGFHWIQEYPFVR